jgi:hypothetical protein
VSKKVTFAAQWFEANFQSGFIHGELCGIPATYLSGLRLSPNGQASASSGDEPSLIRKLVDNALGEYLGEGTSQKEGSGFPLPFFHLVEGSVLGAGASRRYSRSRPFETARRFRTGNKLG